MGRLGAPTLCFISSPTRIFTFRQLTKHAMTAIRVENLPIAHWQSYCSQMQRWACWRELERSFPLDTRLAADHVVLLDN
jgi:hypothetical protein